LQKNHALRFAVFFVKSFNKILRGIEIRCQVKKSSGKSTTDLEWFIIKEGSFEIKVKVYNN